MAIRVWHPRLLAVCVLALPSAFSYGQDVSFNVGQQTTTSEQTGSSSSSTTTTLQSTGSLPQDGNTSTDQNGDAAFGNLGSANAQTSSTGTSHSETRSERRSSSVDIDVGDDDWRHDDDRGNRSPWETDMVGNWTLGKESGNTCTIQLKDTEWFGGHGAYVPAGCPDGFFQATRWVLSGHQLLITDTNNTVIGRFRQSGAGRWSGRRESDGARMYLNPTGQ